MKIRMRTPSLNKSLKARTTGKLKRQMKSAVNPLYGKKGMGWINNPKKAAYNKVYNKTTFKSPLYNTPKKSKKVQHTNSPKFVNAQSWDEATHVAYTPLYTANKWKFLAITFFLGVYGGQSFYIGKKSKGWWSLLFFWTSIPFYIAIYDFFAALFNHEDENHNITIKGSTRTVTVEQFELLKNKENTKMK